MIAATKMRKGHAFHMDKDVGELSNLGQQGKIPMCLLSLFTQPPPLKNGCWWLRQLIVFRSGVAGLSVLTHMHTPPRLTSQWKRNHCDHSRRKYHSPHDVAIAHALPFSCPLCRLFIFTQGNVVHSHTQDFLVLPTQTSPLRICGWAAVSSPRRLILGAAAFLPCECCGLLYD